MSENIERILRVLLIEDDPGDIRLIQEFLLKEGFSHYTLECVDYLQKALARLRTGGIDVILLDLSLPDGKGLETFLKLHQHTVGIPVIILSGLIDDAVAVEAVRQGAQDYLVKQEINRYGLVHAIRYAVERARLKEALLKAHTQTEQLLSSITSILIRVSAEGIVTHWNRIAETTFGLHESEVLHHPLASCRVEWELAIMLRALDECQKHGQPVRLDNVRFKRTSGEEGIAAFTINAVGGSQTGQRDCLMLGADITERRRLETDVKQKTDALAHSNVALVRREQVMKRLVEDLRLSKSRLEEQQRSLHLANRRLEQLGALKDEFVANVSHELRTPLTAIKEGISLMHDRALGEINAEQEEFLKDVDQSIDRLTELITNLLDISKIEAGRMRLSRRKLRFQDVMESTLQSYQALLGSRRIIREYTPNPPVFADSARLMQVFGNLLSNAVKFTHEDGVITFRVTQQEGMVMAAIQDNGMGIATEDLPRLFQKFSQVNHPSDDKRSRGSGLGLAVCKDLVELHRGTITVDSEWGKGTTFTVKLPLYTDEFALTENFRELLDLASSEGNRSVGLIAIHVGELYDPDSNEDDQQEVLDHVCEDVRARLHRGDALVVMEPCWVVVLAGVDANGLRAIIGRLQEAFRGQKVQFGAALYPVHGMSVLTLFEYARQHLSEGLALASSGQKTDTDMQAAVDSGGV